MLWVILHWILDLEQTFLGQPVRFAWCLWFNWCYINIV